MILIYRTKPHSCKLKKFQCFEQKSVLYFSKFEAKIVWLTAHITSNSIFSLLPIRHILQLSYEPKIAKKGGSCYQLWTIKQVPFFSGKITIFQPTACLPGYCKVPIWANGWFLWPKWVPRHIRTCPRFNFENKNLGSCDEISPSRTTVHCSSQKEMDIETTVIHITIFWYLQVPSVDLDNWYL